MNFDSLEALAEHFKQAGDRAEDAMKEALKHAAPAIAAEYKRYFGTYGPGWAVLADRTQRERVKKGFTPDDPLFRSGELQGLVHPVVDGHQLFVGIEQGQELADGTDAALVLDTLERGTKDGRIPPRPIRYQVLTQLDRFAHSIALEAWTRTRL